IGYTNIPVLLLEFSQSWVTFACNMAYKNLSEFIKVLEKENELIRIQSFVNPHLQIAEITDRISKSHRGGKALLFENTGYAFPVLMNSYGSENWMPKVIAGRGQCQEVIIERADITKLPVITCWPKDGGPFVTLPVIHTKDPNNNIRNVGMYRMQVFGPRLTGMHWHKHKVSAKHFNEYKKLNKRMPVAVSLGGDPVYAYAATAPLPENVDEYMLAGFLRKKRVELVKCISQPEIEVPG